MWLESCYRDFTMKFLHVNDAASVAKSLVKLRKFLGVRDFRAPIPPRLLKIPPAKYYWNISVWRIAYKISRFFDFTLHIHGAHLSKFMLSLDRPFVLHIHGSDVRGFDEAGRTIAKVNQSTSEAILKASLVFYSTPDLSPHVREIRPDAIWLPNPIPVRFKNLEQICKSPNESKFADIFFPHAWNDSKGVDLILKLVKDLKRIGRLQSNLKIIGLAIGDRQLEAREAGFSLVAPVSESRHVNRMKNSRIVLGQGTGMIGITDLLGIASGANVILFPLESETVLAYGLSQNLISYGDVLEEVTRALDGDNSQSLSQLKQQVIQKHSNDYVSLILRNSYRLLES